MRSNGIPILIPDTIEENLWNTVHHLKLCVILSQQFSEVMQEILMQLVGVSHRFGCLQDYHTIEPSTTGGSVC